MVSVLLTVSILGLSPTDTMAQGTNATNATGQLMLRSMLEEERLR